MSEVDARPGAGLPDPEPDPAATALARILLVSDHEWWGGDLSRSLTAEGFHVTWDRTGRRVVGQQHDGRTDVAIVDLRMRSASGLAVCSALRLGSGVPMLAMGAPEEEVLIMAAFAAGADQFAASSTSPRLVVARIRALLRRAPAPGSTAPARTDGDGPVRLDETSGTALVSGVVIRLSPREMEVLKTLVAHPGRVVSRAELVRQGPMSSADRRLDFVIRRLRQKLEAVDGRRRINAVRGVGFRLELDLDDPRP